MPNVLQRTNVWLRIYMFVLKGVNYRLLSADRKETYAKHLCPGIACSGTGRACLDGSGPTGPTGPTPCYCVGETEGGNTRALPDAVLDRDLIFLAESGEEADPTGVGINFMVNQHFDEINAEFAITEGGTAKLENGRVTVVQVGTTEKVPRRARLVATGSSGHGSVPRIDNPVVHLGAAVAKIGTWEPPMHLNETTRTYFEKLAGISPPDKAARYRALLDPQRAKQIQRYLAENEPAVYSMLRTSIVPTMLKPGVGPNVIPSEAEACRYIRALPGEATDECN